MVPRHTQAHQKCISGWPIHRWNSELDQNSHLITRPAKPFPANSLQDHAWQYTKSYRSSQNGRIEPPFLDIPPQTNHTATTWLHCTICRVCNASRSRLYLLVCFKHLLTLYWEMIVEGLSSKNDSRALKSLDRKPKLSLGFRFHAKDLEVSALRHEVA